jgi:hypothetical protein
MTGRNSMLRIKTYDGRELVTIDMTTGAIDLHDSLEADLRQAAQQFWGAVHTVWGVGKDSQPLRDIVLLAARGLGGDAGDIVVRPGHGSPYGTQGGDVNIEPANVRPTPVAITENDEETP